MNALEHHRTRPLEDPDPVAHALASAGLSLGLQSDEKVRLAGVCIPRRVCPGQVLFRPHDSLSSVILVRSGCVKSSAVLSDGREQVVRLHLPGALLGLEALGGTPAVVEAAAAQTSELLLLPVKLIAALGQEIPVIHHNFVRAMSHMLVGNHQVMWPLAALTARARVSLFLSSLAAQASLDGDEGDSVGLPAPRRDCASLLRLRPETFSRELTRLGQCGVLRAERGGRRIAILDRERLRRQCPLALDPGAILPGGCHATAWEECVPSRAAPAFCSTCESPPS